MTIPKINSAFIIDTETLLVEFDYVSIKKYNIKPLLQQERFAPLKNAALLRPVQIEQGGYAVFWNSEMDISEYELWLHGETIS